MSLASNTREQLAKRLKADLQLRDGSLTVDMGLNAAGDPLLTVKNGVTVEMVVAIPRRAYNGFNIVAELSSSAAEGLPEHICYAQILSTLSQLKTAKYAMWVKALGTSSMKLSFNAAPAEANMTDANVAEEISNDARVGAVGQ
jgi:hypothetical protein